MELIRYVGSAGLEHRGVARRGSDSVGWRALRPQSPVSRRAPSWQQPRDGRVGRPARADSRAPDSPCHGARDSTAVVRGADGDRAGMTCCCGACCMVSCRNDAAAAEAIPGAIGLSGSRCPVRSFRPARRNSGTPGAGPLRGDVVALVLDGKTFAESTMVVALGITMTGDKRWASSRRARTRRC